jgi:hypothetical protein
MSKSSSLSPIHSPAVLQVARDLSKRLTPLEKAMEASAAQLEIVQLQHAAEPTTAHK